MAKQGAEFGAAYHLRMLLRPVKLLLLPKMKE